MIDLVFLYFHQYAPGYLHARGGCYFPLLTPGQDIKILGPRGFRARVILLLTFSQSYRISPTHSVSLPGHGRSGCRTAGRPVPSQHIRLTSSCHAGQFPALPRFCPDSPLCRSLMYRNLGRRAVCQPPQTSFPLRLRHRLYSASPDVCARSITVSLLSVLFAVDCICSFLLRPSV